ncbi:histidine phosphatase family protein [Janthinobacterium sp.]|uniref:histidine phosphatase family protein n=1 Tax=Janthinobacterium sp. TaxID=1871054 RepID=UPI00293D6F03|nr:histidine phosphatase family protein [Janthinobacterium sp.]
MSTTILLIRHGETTWNAARRLQGHIDIPLNEEGGRQAEALAEALDGATLAAVVASDLQRARQTAAAVAARHGLTVQSDPLLRERCYGAFEGMLYAEIEARYPREYAQWQARDIDALMPSGERAAESFRQFYQRSLDGIARWAARYPGQSIAIVAHGGVLECAYRAAVGMSLDSPRDFQVKNASVNRFAWRAGALTLTQWGDIEHLSAPAIDELG